MKNYSMKHWRISNSTLYITSLIYISDVNDASEQNLACGC